MIKTLKLDDSILKQVSGGIFDIPDADLAREFDPFIREYKRQVSAATTAELKGAGLDEGYRGLILYVEKMRREHTMCLTDEGFQIVEDYIARNYDHIS